MLPDNTYKTVRAAKLLKVGEKFSLFGIVKFLKPLKKCVSNNGSMLVLSLVDDTCDVNKFPDDKLKCNLFVKTTDELPKQTGDIVRFRHLKMHQFNDEPQAQTAIGFSCISVDGTNADLPPRFNTEQKKSLEEVWTDSDKAVVAKLRKWASSIPLKQAISESKAKTRSLSSLSETDMNTYFDVICKLLSVHELRSGAVLLTLWDGTKLENLKQEACKLDADEKCISKADKNNYPPQEYVAEVYVWLECSKKIDKAEKKAMCVSAGDVVTLSNVCIKSHRTVRDCIEFVLHDAPQYGSDVKQVPRDSPESQAITLATEKILQDKRQHLHSTSQAAEENIEDSDSDTETVLKWSRGCQTDFPYDNPNNAPLLLTPPKKRKRDDSDSSSEEL